MIVQDIVFAVANVIFIAALLPSVFSDDKPAFWTSVMTGGVLSVISTTYATLGLWFAFASTAIAAILWFYLAYQKSCEQCQYQPGTSCYCWRRPHLDWCPASPKRKEKVEYNYG